MITGRLSELGKYARLTPTQYYDHWQAGGIQREFFCLENRTVFVIDLIYN
jgi:hypothetical protein